VTSVDRTAYPVSARVMSARELVEVHADRGRDRVDARFFQAVASGWTRPRGRGGRGFQEASAQPGSQS